MTSLKKLNIVLKIWFHHLRDHPYSTYAKFSKNISYPLIRIRTWAYQGVRKVSFSENFAYVLNESSLMEMSERWG